MKGDLPCAACLPVHDVEAMVRGATPQNFVVRQVELV